MTSTTGRFGGFGLDRMLADFEAVIDAPVEEAPAEVSDQTAETAEVDTGAEDTGQEAAPEPGYDPGFDDDERYAEIARAQYEQLQQQGGQQQDAGDTPDLNALLDPLGEDFGTNLAQVIQQAVAQAVAPVTARAQAEEAAAGERAVQEMVTAEIARAPGIPEQIRPKAAELVTALAPSFLDEMNGRYGQSERSVQAAIAKATQTVNELLAEAARGGGQAQIDQLAAVQNAGTAPPGQGVGAINMPERPKSLAELHERTFGIPL